MFVSPTPSLNLPARRGPRRLFSAAQQMPQVRLWIPGSERYEGHYSCLQSRGPPSLVLAGGLQLAVLILDRFRMAGCSLAAICVLASSTSIGPACERAAPRSSYPMGGGRAGCPEPSAPRRSSR